uniref:uncharacterized protein C8orf58 homolog isoform X1 n=1 Tax=Jaculus jaculus TaxID=51337 RepID=UPI001E1B1193|nr:uncharacterized protein C8orf58 homolog isoform X1 [Jaculus jaculus]
MLGRRRVFAVEPLGGQDGACEDLAYSCVVPGVTSTYRRIPDEAYGCSLDSQEGESALKDLERQMPLLKLASQDSGVEMVVGDSPLAILPELSQDYLNLEPMGNPEPPAQLDRLLASRKLKQVLERSRELPGLSRRRHPLLLPSTHVCATPVYAAGLEPTEAEMELEDALEEAEGVSEVGPGAAPCLSGQGFRYLEHLCLVLEQMARLQQLYLQLQTQRPPADSEKEDLAPPPSPAPCDGMQGPGELLSQTKEIGVGAAAPPEVGMLCTNPLKLQEVLVEPTLSAPCSQGHKQDLSHWDKVKVLLNRIRWRSPQHPEPPAPPDGSGPMTESKDLSESPRCRPHRKTFIPSLVVKKPRAKNFSV